MLQIWWKEICDWVRVHDCQLPCQLKGNTSAHNDFILYRGFEKGSKGWDLAKDSDYNLGFPHKKDIIFCDSLSEIFLT